MISNINYKAKTMKENINHLDFNVGKPQQLVFKYDEYTIILFKNGSCRIMGCKKAIYDNTVLPFGIEIERIQSIVVTFDIRHEINLQKLSIEMGLDCMYEPELFPALRYSRYDPLCVNIFATGKIVILGLKSLDYTELVKTIIDDIEYYVYIVINVL